MEVRYDDEALQEAKNAAHWYEIQEEGLALRFLEKWKQAEERMAFAPELNRVFPFKMLYRIVAEDVLQVVAVMQMKRRPGYWKSRTKG